MSVDEQTIPGDKPPYPPPTAARDRLSGLAVTGFILSFLIVPLGFVLSLVAIFRTGPGKARGRGLAVAGTVLSLLFIGIGTAIVVTLANSKQADPGCVEAKDAIIHTAQGPKPQALEAAATQLREAAGKAKHDDVKAAVTAIGDDFAQLATSAKSGSLPDGIEEKVAEDAARVDELCTFNS